jgi:hypothetical protein
LEEKEKWPRFPDGELIPKQTGQLTFGHKITLTLTIPFLSMLNMKVKVTVDN